MTLKRTRSNPGFTLVELLVVIAIIGLLMALLLPAVQKIRSRGDATKATSQINQIAMACAQFKADTGFYPPDNATDAAKVLQAMYPRSTTIGATYNGGGSLTNPNQFLVHFLAGPQGTGWAIDSPVAPGPSATTKKGPWMTFQTSELSGNMVIDPWEKPLQYRASGTGGAYGPTPAGGIAAYTDTGNKVFNQGGVQVISSGPNKAMGSGGNLPTPGTAGADDLANFNGGYQLGARP